MRLNPTAAADLPRSTTRLGDWHANLLIVNRRQLVLAVSTKTLLPVLLPAAPLRTFPARLAGSLEEVLLGLGIESSCIASEVEATREYAIAATNNRQVLGSMTDFSNMLHVDLEARSLLEAALSLAESPCSPLQMDSPIAVTQALFSVPRQR